MVVCYGFSLPFYLFLPVPERWAYPDAQAILLSDLWSARFIETIRPISGLDNCFPSFHVSGTIALVLVWYATFHLARTEAAQPIPFAFGGEADPVDYARALADGALLAIIATLGLLQLGHGKVSF